MSILDAAFLQDEDSSPHISLATGRAGGVRQPGVAGLAKLAERHRRKT